MVNSLKKKRFGQYFTTNKEYIINNLIDIVPENAVVVDTFCGDGDLLSMFKNNITIGLDINPQNDSVKFNNSLVDFNYVDKWVVTNPPYLSKNKNKTKHLYEKYKTDDYYKIFLLTLVESPPKGGIAILPTNFLCSENKKVLIKFLESFYIHKVNIFEEQVFYDTPQSVCSFSFLKKDIKSSKECQNINITFFPTQKVLSTTIRPEEDYIIGHEFYESISHDNELKIQRLENNGVVPNSKLFLRAVDTSTPIQLSVDDSYFYGKCSDRAFATLVFPNAISYEDQHFICNEFNKHLEHYREKYNSMFLTTYKDARNNKTRKRITFRVAFRLVSKIIVENNITTL